MQQHSLVRTKKIKIHKFTLINTNVEKMEENVF